MATPRSTIAHLRLVFGGTTGAGGTEIWANTLKIAPTNPGPPVTVQNQADSAVSAAGLSHADLLSSVAAAKTAVATMWGTMGGQSFYLNYVKLNAFGINDEQITDPTVEVQFSAVEGPISCATPWSSALVFEHRNSQASRGFGTHGRLSLPTGLNVGYAAGKVAALGTNSGTGLTMAAAATAWQTFLQAIPPAMPFSNWIPAILYTSTSTAKPAAGRIIDRFITSDIPGEVRSRQNKLVQSGATTAVAY